MIAMIILDLNVILLDDSGGRQLRFGEVPVANLLVLGHGPSPVHGAETMLLFLVQLVLRHNPVDLILNRPRRIDDQHVGT